MAKKTKDGLTQVFCAAIWNTEPRLISRNGKLEEISGSWSEPYGYMGSYYKTYQKARMEIRWLMRTYPKYTEWYIERRYLDDDKFMVATDKDCVIAHSRGAKIETEA